MCRKQGTYLLFSDSSIFWAKGNVSRQNSFFYSNFMQILFTLVQIVIRKNPATHTERQRTPTKHLFLELPYYSLPHSSYQPNLLYKPTLFSFKLIFLKQRNRERVRGLDKVAICHVGPSPSWSQWGIVLADHNSRVEREKVVCVCVLMQVAISKVHTLWSAWLLFSIFFLFKRFCKKKI